MSIDGSNLLNLLSGAGAVGNLSSAGLASGGDGAGFSAAFLEQLGALQASLANGGNAGGEALSLLNQADLPASAQAAMQNFAALFGNGMPPANSGELTMAQDDSLKDALAEVMLQLQALEASTDASSLAEAVDVPDVTKPAIQTDLDEQQQALAASLLAQAMPTPAAQTLEDTGSINPESVETVGPFISGLPAKKPADFQVVAKQADLPASSNSEQESFAQEFDRSIGALLGQNSAEAGSGDKDSQGAMFQSDNLATLADAPQNGDKAMAGIAGDIAKLNQTVRGSAQTEVPPMSKHLSDPAWNNELGQKLIWMHKQSIPSAELRLNPEHLGPVLIKIDMNQDQASISFTAQNQAVKEAIEAALPKLREMFSGQQLDLADVNVSQHQSEQGQARDFFQSASQQGQNSRQSEGDEVFDNGTTAGNDIADEIEAGRAIASNGLLSLFA